MHSPRRRPISRLHPGRAEAAHLLARLLAQGRVADRGDIVLGRYPTDSTIGTLDKASGRRALAAEAGAIAALQAPLAAARRSAVLLLLQSMDAGGKDSAIRHVFKGVDPGGLRIASFKAPSQDELGQDFLRRTSRALPLRGQIGVFNRSYYEEVLITRLHPELLRAEHLPKAEMTEDLWRGRLADIAAHEGYLTRQGIVVLKVFLHISKEEQRQRFLRRLRRPDKIWKFDAADLAERALWDRYGAAYGEAIGATATADAPWHIIPADHKWVARLLVARLLRDTLERLNPEFPQPDGEAARAAEEARRKLEAE